MARNALVMARTAATSLFQDANCKAYYNLEDLVDLKGGFNLTNYNSVTFTSAKFNNGSNLGTSNSTKYLEIANNLGIDGGAISIVGWIKLTTEITTGSYYMLSQCGTTSKTLLSIAYNYNGGTPNVEFLRAPLGAATQSFTTTVTLGTSNWNHFALCYDATNIVGYINGVRKGSAAASGNGSSAVQDHFDIGVYNFNGTPTAYSSIIADDVAVFNRALTQAEVSLLNTKEVNAFRRAVV